MKTTGYQDMPDWPVEAPDTSVRNVEVPVWKDERETIKGATKKQKQKSHNPDMKSFYSSSEDDDSDEDDDDDDEDSKFKKTKKVRGRWLGISIIIISILLHIQNGQYCF